MMTRGLMKPSSALNVVWDGNSLVAGSGASGSSKYLPAQTMALAPLVGSGATSVNCGVSGQSFRMMNGLDSGSAADVDAAWASGKYNVLVPWEITNTIAFYGRSVAQCVQDCIDYIAARKAVHPWRVILPTALPRYGASDALLVQFNALARANYRAWGADALVDIRAPGSKFDFDGTLASGFQATQSLWSDTSAWVHLNDAGYAEAALNHFAPVFRRLPVRAAT